MLFQGGDEDERGSRLPRATAPRPASRRRARRRQSTSNWLCAPSTADAPTPVFLQDGHETRGPAVVAASDGAVVDLDGHAARYPEARPVPVDDRRELDAGLAASRRRAAVAEARGAERVRDGGIAVADEQRALQRRARAARRAAGRVPRAPSASASSSLSGHRRVQPRLRAGGELDLRRNASSALGSRSTARRTSSALTLPEPSQIELSGLSRKSRGSCDSST